MTDSTELARVLAELDKGYAWSVETGKGGRPTTEALRDAARLLRELAEDYAALDRSAAMAVELGFGDET